MSDLDKNKLGLYEHNLLAYEKVKEAFDNGEDVVGIVHATGTGKTYIAEALTCDNPDKKVVWLVPSNSIAEHVIGTIEDNPELNFQRDFSNLEFRTYQSLVDMSEAEISDLNVDLLIVDEFHHIGAPIWGQRVNKIIETHNRLKVFGMTAYTVRDRGTSFERNMANPDTNELFSNKIVSRYDLADALLDGVLPLGFSYRTAHSMSVDNEEISHLESKLSRFPDGDEKTKYKSLVDDYKKRITDAKGIKDVILECIKKDSKIIYFCPPSSVKGINDIETIMDEARDWFKGYVDDDDIVFYSTTSEMGSVGKKNREAFYRDETLDGKSAKGKLRIMFAINQYNEGVHAPNVNGIIMGRGTSSDIVYFEQLGRALSVSGEDNPIIIDLTNNFEFIKQLENELRGKVKERKKYGYGFPLNVELLDCVFDIKIENEDLYETLRYLKDKLAPVSWEEMYNLARNYYEQNNNLEIPATFKTKDGISFDECGRNLGIWVKTQRDFELQGVLSDDRKELLSQIGMRFGNDKYDQIWKRYYLLAKSYFEYYHDLEVPSRFRTNNGYELSSNGMALGNWVRVQRKAYAEGTLIGERRELLEQIGMRLGVSKFDIQWQEMYELACVYYDTYNDLEIPSRFKTKDGITPDSEGKGLGSWIKVQREMEKADKLDTKRKELLEKIGMRFEIKDNDKEWKKMYHLAQSYYEEHQNLEVSQEFKTNDGIDFDPNGKCLGTWIVTQRRYYQDGRLLEERKKLLDAIGMRFEPKDYNQQWMEMYDYAKAYYEQNGNLEIPARFVADNGKKLGKWIVNQRTEHQNGILLDERKELLEEIGMRFQLKRKSSKSKK